MENQDKTATPDAPARRRPGPRPSGKTIDAATRKRNQRVRDNQFKDLDALSTSGLCAALCSSVSAGHADNTQTVIQAIYRRLHKVIEDKAAARAKKEAAEAKKAARLAAKLAKSGNPPGTA